MTLALCSLGLCCALLAVAFAALRLAQAIEGHARTLEQCKQHSFEFPDSPVGYRY